MISAVGHETDFTICDFVSDMRAPTPSAAAEIALPDTGELRARISHLRHKADMTVSRRTLMLESRLDALKKSCELHSPVRVLEERSAKLVRLEERLDVLVKKNFDGSDNRFRMLCARLEGVNPLAVLSHGYAMVESEDGRIISSISDVRIGERVDIGLSDGNVQAEIINIKENSGEV